MKKRKCTHKNIALRAWLALGIAIEERLNNDVVGKATNPCSNYDHE